MGYIILAIVAVIVVVFVVVVALQPAAFRVERSTTISAPGDVVFGQVNDFHSWEAWSPWAKLDPAMKTTYSGSVAGAGAIYSWSGDKKVGAGKMTVVDSQPNDLVRIKLEFLRPFKATNTAEFTFQPVASQTRVMWAMTGRKNFFFKAFGLFMNMDKVIGGDFEKGLANMKSEIEGGRVVA